MTIGLLISKTLLLDKSFFTLQIEMDLCLNAGVVPSNIILANTIKFRSDITFAVNQGVQLMTFDNEHELMKIKENAPNAR